jgi:signal transduction histidine kinase
LGLPICRRIVEQHHGRLEVESEVGEGTTFRVTLPVQAPTDHGGARPD